MNAIQMYIKGHERPTVTMVQGDTSMSYGRDGIVLMIHEPVETADGKTTRFHKWEEVIRLSIVDADQVCPSCLSYLKANDLETCYKCAEQATMLNPITIEKHHGQRSTLYKLTYNPDVPFADIRDSWFGLYHPEGYGTKVLQKGFDENGNRKIEVVRENSSD